MEKFVSVMVKRKTKVVMLMWHSKTMRNDPNLFYLIRALNENSDLSFISPIIMNI